MEGRTPGRGPSGAVPSQAKSSGARSLLLSARSRCLPEHPKPGEVTLDVLLLLCHFPIPMFIMFIPGIGPHAEGCQALAGAQR